MRQETYCLVALAALSLLSFFFQYSRRMNARLETPAPRGAPPSRVAGLAVKLRLLPDAQTGQRANLLPLLCAAWITAYYPQWLYGSEFIKARLALRAGFASAGQARQGLGGLWSLYIAACVIFLCLALPLFLVRKNREFYFDVFALFTLFQLGAGKLLLCWPMGCCHGSPCAWGVYNQALDTAVFPLQLLESAASFLAFFVCVLFMLYTKSYRPGRGAALCLFFYAAPRFFWEFLRYKDEAFLAGASHGLFGLSMVQTVCVALCILAVAWWLWLLPLEKKLMDRLWLSHDRRRGRI